MDVHCGAPLRLVEINVKKLSRTVSAGSCALGNEYILVSVRNMKFALEKIGYGSCSEAALALSLLEGYPIFDDLSIQLVICCPN